MYNNTAIELLQELNISGDTLYPSLKALSDANSKYLRDLKLNVKTSLASEALGEKDALLVAYAIAVNAKNRPYKKLFLLKRSQPDLLTTR